MCIPVKIEFATPCTIPRSRYDVPRVLHITLTRSKNRRTRCHSKSAVLLSLYVGGRAYGVPDRSPNNVRAPLGIRSCPLAFRATAFAAAAALPFARPAAAAGPAAAAASALPWPSRTPSALVGDDITSPLSARWRTMDRRSNGRRHQRRRGGVQRVRRRNQERFQRMPAEQSRMRRNDNSVLTPTHWCTSSGQRVDRAVLPVRAGSGDPDFRPGPTWIAWTRWRNSSMSNPTVPPREPPTPVGTAASRRRSPGSAHDSRTFLAAGPGCVVSASTNRSQTTTLQARARPTPWCGSGPALRSSTKSDPRVLPSNLPGSATVFLYARETLTARAVIIGAERPHFENLPRRRTTTSHLHYNASTPSSPPRCANETQRFRLPGCVSCTATATRSPLTIPRSPTPALLATPSRSGPPIRCPTSPVIETLATRTHLVKMTVTPRGDTLLSSNRRSSVPGNPGPSRPRSPRPLSLPRLR